MRYTICSVSGRFWVGFERSFFFLLYFLLFSLCIDDYLLALHLSSGVVMPLIFFFFFKFIFKLGVINSVSFSLWSFVYSFSPSA